MTAERTSPHALLRIDIDALVVDKGNISLFFVVAILVLTDVPSQCGGLFEDIYPLRWKTLYEAWLE